MGRGRVECYAGEESLRVGKKKVQRAGVRVGGVSEPATEEEKVLRAGGEDFEEERAGGHVIIPKEF